jgi:hypothetical protein
VGTRQLLVNLVRERPSLTVTAAAIELGVSEARVRALLRREKIALPGQWAARRRRGVKVISLPGNQARPPSPWTTHLPVEPQAPLVRPILPRLELSPTWAELRRKSQPPSRSEVLATLRRRYPSWERLHGIGGALAFLEGVERGAVCDWTAYSGHEPPRAPPQMFRLIPKESVGPLVLANLLLAEVRAETAGAYDQSIVPEDETELVRSALNFGSPGESECSRLWANVEVALRRARAQAVTGRAFDCLMLMSLGPLIRRTALDELVLSCIRAAEPALRVQIERETTRARCEAFGAELEAGGGTSLGVRDQVMSRESSANSAQSRTGSVKSLLATHATHTSACSSRTALLLQAATWTDVAPRHFLMRRRGAGAIGVGVVADSIATELQQLVPLIDSEDTMFEQRLIISASKARALFELRTS